MSVSYPIESHDDLTGHREAAVNTFVPVSEPFAVDLFCGAGGLSYGLKQAGVNISAGVDIDPACRHPFEENVKAKFYEKDVAELSPAFIKALFPRNSTKILAGCAPCQPFSAYTKGTMGRDHHWRLLRQFGDVIAAVRPEIVTMENVPRLRRHPVFEDFLAILRKFEYCFSHQVVSCTQYGVPQRRKRLVLLASKLGEINLVPGTYAKKEFETVRNAIYHLDAIQAGGTSASDPLHKSSSLSVLNLTRIRHSKPGGTWRDWDEGLRAVCHTRESGRTYPSVYGRMVWDKPAPTITTQFHGYGNGRFGHPSQDRALSLREGAILQSFPEDYSFVSEGETPPFSSVAKLIGNAVPVNLGEAIGKSIIQHLVDVHVSKG